MSKRSQPIDLSTQESESHKKHKPNSLTIHHLTQDEMSIVLNFLHKGEILILATLCKQLYSTIYNLVESIIHPREFNVDSLSSTRSLESMLSHYSWLDVGKKTIRKEIEEMANRGGIERLAKVFYAEFEDADDVFSIPLRKEDKYSKISQQWIKLSNKYQDTRNTVEETVIDQVPVGFQVRKLCLVSDNPFKTLNYLQNIEELLLHRNHAGNVVPLSDGFRAIVLNKLRILRIDLSDCEHYLEGYISGLLQLSPNLERLEITSSLIWDDKLIVFISEMCKKLKKIKLKGYSNISDDSLYKLFKNLPHLTHFEIENNEAFTGKFLSKIGEFPQLKFFKVDRRGDELIESCADVHLGGGVLPNLEYLELGISYESIYENEHLFMESLKLVTPNLKCAGSMINLYEGYVCRYATATLNLFVDTLESFTLSTISALFNPIIAAKFFKLLPNVTSFKVEGVLTLDVLKELEIHSKVEKLTLETTTLSLEYLLSLSKVFPNLKILKFKENVSSSYDTQTSDVQNVLKVLKDGHFQRLEMISIYGMQFLDEWPEIRKEFVSERPFLLLLTNLGDEEGSLEFSDDQQKDFEYKWLVLDKNSSKLDMFPKNDFLM